MSRLALLFLVCVVLRPAVAVAEEEETLARVMAHDERARELFEAESFAEALAEMRAAQELMPATARLYNMARCEEGLGNIEAAMALYREFIAAEDAPGERRTRALERLEALDDHGGEEPPAQPGGSDGAEDGAGAGPGEGEGPEPPPAGEGAPSGLAPTAFHATLGVTAAAGAALLALGVTALVLDAEFDELYREDQRAMELEDTGGSIALAANVMIGVTAAAAAATLLLALFTDFGSGSILSGATTGPALAVSPPGALRVTF